ncbi:MAG: hypothetical protein CMJ64_28430 [Planctomycetaceae bacterium]|nr:hypothetical protein [Planctomycetaceae bacterium]
MAEVVWTPVAEADLDDILYYIAMEDGRRPTAERIYLEIKNVVDRQAQEQRLGRRYPQAPAGWLYVQHKRWLVGQRHFERG